MSQLAIAKENLGAEAVKDMIDLMLTIFVPKLNEGVKIKDWARTMLDVIGDEHDPKDVNTATVRLMRIATGSGFPMPATILAEIERARELRAWKAENEVHKRRVQWLDMTTPMPERTHFRLTVGSVEERDALQARLDALDREERYEEAADLFFGKWLEIAKDDDGKPYTKGLPAKYRNTIPAV